MKVKVSGEKKPKSGAWKTDKKSESVQTQSNMESESVWIQVKESEHFANVKKCKNNYRIMLGEIGWRVQRSCEV